MALTTISPALQDSQAQYTGFKNRIINGAMMIDQRNAGASVTATTSGPYTLDRWNCFGSVNSKFTVQQNAGSVTPPAGFKNYLGVTSSSAYTVGASETYQVVQVIEGFNTADFAWGSASAATVTLSFWVRSSLTGTFGGTIGNDAGTRTYPFSFTISSANTWEYKTITIVGETSGAWLTTNGGGVYLKFSMGAGSSLTGTAGSWVTANKSGVDGQVNLVGTNGATFYITGVQLEKGSTATSFDYRPYGTEFQLCQRYYQLFTCTNQEWIYVEDSATPANRWMQIYIPQAMRTSPSSSYANLPTGVSIGGVGTISSFSNGGSPSLNRLSVRVTCTGTGGVSHQIYHTDALSGYSVLFSAEL